MSPSDGTGAADCKQAGAWRLSLSAPFALTARLADLLAEMPIADPPAVSMHESKNPAIWGLDAYFETKPDLEAIEKLLETAHTPLPAIELKQIEAQDWVALVQSGLSPIRAGRYFIHGSHDRGRARHYAGDIEIDAGQAFGTAHHGTTKGCLLALDHLLRNRPSRRYQRVLDLGTGTGVLAIAAARMLGRRVLASDIDPISVQIAARNAALNNIGPLVRVVEADGLRHRALQSNGPHDLLIANILARPLLDMAPDIGKTMRPQSHLVMSGLLRTQSRAIEARYRNQGFTLIKRLPLDEWMTLILQYQ